MPPACLKPPKLLDSDRMSTAYRNAGKNGMKLNLQKTSFKANWSTRGWLPIELTMPN